MDHQPKRSLPERGLSLLCAAAMVAGMVFGNLDTPSVSASEQVLSCSQSEHTHGGGCYQDQLTCGKEEHTHAEGCYDENNELICGKEEHAHGEGCYTKTLICGQSEHTHSAGCYTVQETQMQTAAETAPETAATEKVTETTAQRDAAPETTQTASETSAPAQSDTAAQETQPSSGQETAAPSSETSATEKVTEKATESETAAKELKTSVSTKAKYAVAGKDDLVFDTKISGGTEPYTVKYEIKLDGKTVYEKKEFDKTVTYQPKNYGVHTLYMEVTDAAGKSSKAECSVPVAVNETENSGIWQQSVQSVTLTGDYAKDIVAVSYTHLTLPTKA